MTSVFYPYDECARCFVDEINNRWSEDGVLWHPRIGNPKTQVPEMAKKPKKEEPTEATGKHFDEGKPRLDLFDAAFYLSCGEALTYGAKKYGADNWKGGIAYRKLIGSAERHIAQFKMGETTDSESGLGHLAHAAINLMMIYWMSRNKPEMDDRSSK